MEGRGGEGAKRVKRETMQCKKPPFWFFLITVTAEKDKGGCNPRGIQRSHQRVTLISPEKYYKENQRVLSTPIFFYSVSLFPTTLPKSTLYHISPPLKRQN
jgi:hypothetical protein